MTYIDYGEIHLKIRDVMNQKNISVSKLAFKTEMQRSQLKAYMEGSVSRIDLGVLARICHELDCGINDIMEYCPISGRFQ